MTFLFRNRRKNNWLFDSVANFYRIHCSIAWWSFRRSFISKKFFNRMDPKFHGIQWTSQGSIDQSRPVRDWSDSNTSPRPVSDQFETSLSRRPGRDQSQISLRPVRDHTGLVRIRYKSETNLRLVRDQSESSDWIPW